MSEDMSKEQVEEKILETEEKVEEVNQPSLEEQLETANDKIEELEAKNEEAKADVLRAAADVENIRKRSEREVQNAHKFGIERFAKELLPVMDSIEQALKQEVKTDEAISMKEGVELTSKVFTDTLIKFGMEILDPKGEKFDPNMHEAMAMIPNPELENDTIFDVFQKGYVLNGRVVRAAKVVIVKN